MDEPASDGDDEDEEVDVDKPVAYGLLTWPLDRREAFGGVRWRCEDSAAGCRVAVVAVVEAVGATARAPYSLKMLLVAVVVDAVVVVVFVLVDAQADRSVPLDNPAVVVVVVPLVWPPRMEGCVLVVEVVCEAAGGT